VEAAEVVEVLMVEEAGTMAVVVAFAALDEETLLLEDAREDGEEVTDATDTEDDRVEETAVVVVAARVEDCVGLSDDEALEMNCCQAA
jgi:hypothetical protein